jgi:hypothetical protein
MTPDDVLAALLRDSTLPTPMRRTHAEDRSVVITVRRDLTGGRTRALTAIWYERVPARSGIDVTDATGPAHFPYTADGLERALAELRR